MLTISGIGNPVVDHAVAWGALARFWVRLLTGRASRWRGGARWWFYLWRQASRAAWSSVALTQSRSQMHSSLMVWMKLGDGIGGTAHGGKDIRLICLDGFFRAGNQAH